MDTKAIADAAGRLTGKAAAQIQFLPLPEDDAERYRVSDSGKETIRVEGNTPSAMMAGLRWYLQERCRWTEGKSAALPEKLPPVGETREQATPFRCRYALNYCTYSYSMAFWDWPQWEQELDRMALRGVNLALSLTGQEETVRRMLRRLGLDEAACRAYLPGPAHLAWFWMGNMTSFGGPLPEGWFADRVSLAKKIHRRMGELGITPVLPGFTGMAPEQLAQQCPGVHLHSQGRWCGFIRPSLLDPEDPLFEKAASIYYEEQKALFGDITPYYAADPFHEGGSFMEYDLPAYGEKLLGQMEAAHPGAVWVLQGWGSNPRRAMLQRIPENRLLILNLLAGREKLETWTDSFYGTPWVWCPVHNYGGRNGMFGFLRTAAREPFALMDRQEGRSLCGTGTAPEALEGSPVFYELMGDLSFAEKPVDMEEWLSKFVVRRYGKAGPNALAAWKLLEDSVYNSFLPQPGGAESFFCARPDNGLRSVSTWGPKMIGYDTEFVRRAAALLYGERRHCGQNGLYLDDLADVTRQALSNWARTQYEKAMYLLEQGDGEAFQAAKETFLEALLAQDRLLATRRKFLLGPRLQEARELGARYRQAEEFERAAKTLLTVWGTEEASVSLHDYASREWAGLTGSLYYRRWKLFFEQAAQQFLGRFTAAKDWDDGQEATAASAPIDWYAVESAWIEENTNFPTEPVGDTIEAAGEILTRFLGE